ncbi:MAG: shikimate dehydrogenase [Caldilineales bacterium]
MFFTFYTLRFTKMLQITLIGYPLAHSVSPAMHNAAFAALGIEGCYTALPTPPGQLAATVRGLAAAGYCGANVTIPHKQAVMPLLDELSAAAQAIGAVNTICVQRRGDVTTLRGDNTDWLGFLQPLDASGFDVAGKRALLLGAGGSARAVVYALLRRGLSELHILARNNDQAAALARHTLTLAPRLTIHHSPLPHLSTCPPAHLLINTTPLGMWPQVNTSPWPDDLPLPAGALAYDLVYRPERTRFLQQAQAAGCAIQGGLAMLVGQGAAAFELWSGHTPPAEVMLAAARAELDGVSET